MSLYFLGIDVGNSKSHALIAASDGAILGWGAAGCGSWEGIGYDNAQSVLHTLVRAALASAGLKLDQLAGAGFGYAGYDWPEDEAPHRAMIASLPLKAPYALVNDTIVGLVAGASQGWGVVVVAGTSNNARGRDPHGREARVTGHGPWMGEYGGAHEIVRRATQAVAAAWTGRGPATALTDAFIARTGAHSIDDLIAGLARERYHLGPAAAPEVVAAAQTGDPVAGDIIDWAGRELGSLATTIIRRLNLENTAVEVVLSGSVYNAGPLLLEPLRATVLATAPGARLVQLQAPPVVGGVLLGMRAAGYEPQQARPRLLKQAQQLLAPIHSPESAN